MKALILDDDRSVLALLERVLSRCGYEVNSYSDPSACPIHCAKSCAVCPLAADGCPDVILTDVVMPYVNGLDFVEGLQRIGCKCRHIAMMSGDWQDGYVEKASRMGVHMFTKPFQLEQFERWLETVADEGAHADHGTT